MAPLLELDGLSQDQVDAFVDAVDALGPLHEPGRTAGFEGTQVTRCDGRWLAFTQPRFAGPRTEWRGLHLDERSTWEVLGVDRLATSSPALPRPSNIVYPATPVGEHDIEELDEDDLDVEIGDADGHLGPGVHALVFAPSTAGATLGELLDASATQRARFDIAVAAHMLNVIARELLVDEAGPRARAIDVDHVLVGFDGDVLARGHLPWWGARRWTRAPSGRMTSTTQAASRRLLGELMYELFTSRRMPRGREPMNLSFPGLEKRLRDPLRALAHQLLEGSLVADVGDLWERDVMLPDVDAVLERIAMLSTLAGAVDNALIGSIARGVFPERWERERRIRQLIEDHLS